jgi:hypothetical protein
LYHNPKLESKQRHPEAAQFKDDTQFLTIIIKRSALDDSQLVKLFTATP